MKFTELDRKLRVFEEAHDHCVLPKIFIVARIDGRNFSRLTKETYAFAAPFDSQFRDYMVATTQHLMSCGFRVLYGYTQSDEISLLLHPEEESFGRKLRKLTSILAGEASAKFSLLLGGMAVFDCRISQLPTPELVVDYFRWRSEDAHRNALNAHCYWMLRKTGLTAQDATQKLDGLSVGAKNEFLFQQGNINFNDLPLWQKRGVGVFWEQKELKIDLKLPMRDEYDRYLLNLINPNPHA